ncbi:MAG: hypothetical protein FWH53_04845 [Leptospirales bacterium]|nr:hypothetical protein [Leptospirales bacterium]
MKFSGELGIEFKSGIVFSIIALVLSMAAGLIGRVPFGMIFFRSLLIIPLFFFVGFGVLIIMKKFVPEVYEAITNYNGTGTGDSVENVDISYGGEGFESEYSGNSEENFTEFTEDDFDKVESTNADNVHDTSGGKLGKHIIVDNQQLNGYEPKVMAEAIRTMMHKDKD